MLKEIREWLIAIAIALVVVVVIRMFLFTTYSVDGLSMDPTFEEGDRVIVNKFIYDIADVERDDIVVFDSHNDAAYVKRIIGVPGDNVEMRDRVVYVNGEPIEEDYVVHQGETYMDNFTLESLGVEEETIPEGQYLVLGDNRPISRDSRDFGLITEEDIIGEVQLRFWPFNEIAIDF
ncbi:signal peptidase I [Jeotgalicoccus huakuii]|uniref:signal peptidase I n=1 Tax=Jeotgalicoccus TaxID=227979 RepID=UPI000406F0E1|nr:MULTISPECIES: signal peptidase I [Jeotgalicoccus]MCK1976351.1 signal peptidase I [Jeotgalicoccus huakuii]QQD85935.1 signal peptidase I [Jeotgalicoccus sp. ATCC 8456]